jgi:hypothetical protein
LAFSVFETLDDFWNALSPADESQMVTDRVITGEMLEQIRLKSLRKITKQVQAKPDDTVKILQTAETSD